MEATGKIRISEDRLQKSTPWPYTEKISNHKTKEEKINITQYIKKES